MKKATLIVFLMGLLSIGSASATPFNISIVADNDFTVFSGTNSAINSVLYQNNVGWGSQIAALSTLQFNLAASDDIFYILAMGGGGAQENISGLINGVNMTDPSVSVSMSTNISSFLSNYASGNVASGIYNASLFDVQTAFSSAGFAWGAPTLNSNQHVINLSGFGSGYTFASNSAHLFKFEASDVGVNAVPEPSLLAIGALGLIGLTIRARRRRRSA